MRLLYRTATVPRCHDSIARYDWQVTVHFRHRGLRRLHAQVDSSGMPPQHLSKVRTIPHVLEQATSLEASVPWLCRTLLILVNPSWCTVWSRLTSLFRKQRSISESMSAISLHCAPVGTASPRTWQNRLEQAFGGTADVWMRMQASYDLAQARLRGDQIQSRRWSRLPSCNTFSLSIGGAAELADQ